MDLDRQAIERRDFPVGRRGYDTGAVDAHLRAVGEAFEELRRTEGGAAEASLATSAGNQVQSIIEAAETAAAEIEQNARRAAREARDAADREAQRTRDDAIEKARAHVAGVAQLAATLLERVGSMDREAGGLVESLRSGATRLAEDLAAVEAGMEELYDAAAGRSLPDPDPALASEPGVIPESERSGASAEPVAASAPREPPPATPPPPPPAPVSAGDLDGARLIALNMALNGESRAETERYLAENFQLPDRVTLVDEVYAAIEG